MRFLNASDRLSLIFMSLLGIIDILFNPDPGRLLATYCVMAAGVFSVAWFRERNGSKPGFYLHVAFTFVLILVIFESLGELIPSVRSGTEDALLIRIDHALFGVHPTVWMERFITPLLTGLLQFAYISYYFIPVALGVTLIFRGRIGDFEHALFGIVLCFYLSYIGYLLVPAIGPRFTLKELQTSGLDATPFIARIQEILNGLERNKTDAFPSGHTAIALVSLYYAGKMRERVLFSTLLPVVSALVFSTVYLRYHYVIDVIGGMGLALLTLLLAPALERMLSRASRDPRNEGHESS